MDDWKMQQGNLGPEPEDANDPDNAMYLFELILITLHTVTKLCKILANSFPIVVIN